MPDFSLIAVVCGSFALIWMFLRTILIFHFCVSHHGAVCPHGTTMVA
jgi:hypothetical protein